MTEREIKAKLKGLAWLLVGAIGTRLAMEFLRELAAEIDKDQWTS